ncbi:UPF0223 family protein [Sporosarcina sp. G11-34]|uniref:UPF0223 family protein n=1 Tax=Sporosarcina sp. G11-34 TaxID=2849605 RepID=UPI0022A9DCA6|nr:UPF0223 family protein [Sporosarcina sp. G11-34]MCZ2258921.1 UPF0223 family protein [Sporosarcina sp. G11-34]
MDYNYPIVEDWTVEELVTVMEFYESVEKAYETGISRVKFMGAYRAFKEIVPSKSEEKKLFKEFEKVSGYSSYSIVSAARDLKDEEMIKGKV